MLKSNVNYSQLSPCDHPAITDTPIIRTAAKSQEKVNYRHLLTDINFRYYGLTLMTTLTRGPYSVCAIKGVDCSFFFKIQTAIAKLKKQNIFLRRSGIGERANLRTAKRKVWNDS